MDVRNRMDNDGDSRITSQSDSRIGGPIKSPGIGFPAD